MQLVTVRLDRIFDVVHLQNRQNLTLFGFQYGETRVFGVSAPGQQHLAVGEVLTACLAIENDWTTLLGWYNHTTRATVVESAADDIISVVMAIVFAAVGTQYARPHPVMVSVVLLCMAAWGYGCVRSLLLRRRAHAAIASIKSAPIPMLAPPPAAEHPATP